MTRQQDWKDSSHALRRLLHELPDTRARSARYKFGAILHERRGLWYVYNRKTDNVIATVKMMPERIIIRYRPNSFYADILSRYQYDVETVHIGSPNLSRSSGWVRSNLREAMEHSYREGISPSRSVRRPAGGAVGLVEGVQISGDFRRDEYTVRVPIEGIEGANNFIDVICSAEPSDLVREITSMVRTIAQEATVLPTSIGFGELRDAFNAFQENRQPEAPTEEMSRTSIEERLRAYARYTYDETAYADYADLQTDPNPYGTVPNPYGNVNLRSLAEVRDFYRATTSARERNEDV